MIKSPLVIMCHYKYIFFYSPFNMTVNKVEFSNCCIMIERITDRYLEAYIQIFYYCMALKTSKVVVS